MFWMEHLNSANWIQAGRMGLCAYLLGCVTAGYYLVRFLAGRDIREMGSGSVGAKNVNRALGRGGFLLTALFDFGKGALVAWAAPQFTGDERLVVMAMLAVVAGHIWPVQLRFRGGKGMATSLGALLVFDPLLAGLFAALFLCLFALLRKTVLPGLGALACVPPAAMFLGHDPTNVVLLSFLAGIVLVAHRKNMAEELSQLAPRRHSQPKPDRPAL